MNKTYPNYLFHRQRMVLPSPPPPSIIVVSWECGIRIEVMLIKGRWRRVVHATCRAAAQETSSFFSFSPARALVCPSWFGRACTEDHNGLYVFVCVCVCVCTYVRVREGKRGCVRVSEWVTRVWGRRNDRVCALITTETRTAEKPKYYYRMSSRRGRIPSNKRRQ